MPVQIEVDVQETPLLSTKLYMPPAGQEWVQRPRLIERLDAGLRAAHKLTLVSAPAGFGKTSLLSEWIHSGEGSRKHGVGNRVHAEEGFPTPYALFPAPRPSFAWLSLDGDDDEPRRFWRYVIAALRTVEPAIGQAVDETLRAPGPQPEPLVWRPLVMSLLNEVAVHARGDGPPAGPCVLVLDDYHVIGNEAIHEGIDYLLDHAPPALHLAIASREDPPLSLSRLRGRGQLTEVRAADLRFTPEETAHFLNATMGLGLSADQVTALDSRTEGWIVGLQMAALSLRGQGMADRRDFVATFAGDDRYVADYLVDEVLGRQPPTLQRFLLRTSILDRLCGPLCDAVTEPGTASGGREEGAVPLLEQRASPSQAVLEALQESNLFLVPLDSRRQWYRYHRLFADLLRARLQEGAPDEVPALHARASAWYEGEGLAAEAISHAVAAADHERAADILERHYGGMASRGESGTLERWLDALPDAVLRARPLLSMGRGSSLLDHDPSRAEEWIEHALQASAADPQPLAARDGVYETDHGLIAAHAAVFRVNGVWRREQDPAVLVQVIRAALDEVPAADLLLRGILTFYLGQAHQRLGDDDAADRAFAEARQMGRMVEGHAVALAVTGVQAQEAWNRGDLHMAAAICEEAIQTLVEPTERAGGRLPFACFAYVLMGRVLLEWNRTAEARRLLVRGVDFAEEAREPGMEVDGCRDLAVLHWVQGDYQQAHAWMDRAVRACTWDPGYLHALRARIWLAQAEEEPHWLDVAAHWAEGHPLVDPVEYSWELQSLARVRIAQYRAHGAPDLAPVLAVLKAHLVSVPRPSTGRIVQTSALLALAHQALGQIDAALGALERAIDVAATTGHVTALLEHGAPMAALLREAAHRRTCATYARTLLDAFADLDRAGRRRVLPEATSPEREAPAQGALIEPLSERELEVLRLLASALSGPEIADALTIELSTLRSHTKSIYGKLGAHSRREAVARARALGLLPDQADA